MNYIIPFQIAYIAAFNAMEAELRKRDTEGERRQKIAFHIVKHLSSRRTRLCFSEAANVLGTTIPELATLMVKLGHIYAGRRRMVPTTYAINEGFLAVVEWESDRGLSPRYRMTGRGLMHYANIMSGAAVIESGVNPLIMPAKGENLH